MNDRVALLVGLSALVALVSGLSCGKEPDHEAEITALISTFYIETYSGDFDQAYELLASESKARCTRENFEKSEGNLRRSLAQIQRTWRVDRVEEITVKGKFATAKVYITNGEPRYYWPVPPDTWFIREKGKWRYLYDSNCITWEWTDRTKLPVIPLLPTPRPTRTPLSRR